MKKQYIIVFAAIAAICACTKTKQTYKNDANKKYLEAYVQVNYPEAKRTALGSYVIETKSGNGVILGDSKKSPYIVVDYDTYDLNGKLQKTTNIDLAHRTGLAGENSKDFFGPVVWTRHNNGLSAGLDEVVTTMEVGGSTKVIIPGWLSTFDRYSSAQEYEKYASGTPYRFEIKIHERIDDIGKWELDSLDRYLRRNFPNFNPSDSLENGVYFISTRKPSSEEKFKIDTSFKINYIGRLLDGSVFDTNIKDTAKYYGLYKTSGSYSPITVKLAEDYSEITFGGNKTIPGFSRVLSELKPDERGVALFTSTWGYGVTGTGASIPAYSPLRFDIDIVEE